MHTLGKEDFFPLKALKEDWVVKPQNTIQTLPKKTTTLKQHTQLNSTKTKALRIIITTH